MKLATKRALAATAVLGVVGVGLALHTGVGTPSAWGIGSVAALCPLGAVEAAIASRTIVPPLFIGLAIAVALVALFGRAFCAWGCPVPLLRRVFGVGERKRDANGKGREGEDAPCEDRGGDGVRGEAEIREECASCEGSASCGGREAGESRESREASESRKLRKPRGLFAEAPASERGGAGDSRNWVLGATVLTTAAFGFPVFCLICPVGLTIATFIALWRVFQFSEVTLSLVVFPLVLVAELLLTRRWCHRFCPLGALLGLLSRLNRTFRPTVNAEACLRQTGAACSHCADVCPEGIDLHHAAISAPIGECTKCGECADTCPAHAISFPFLPSSASKAQRASVRRGDGAGLIDDEAEAKLPS